MGAEDASGMTDAAITKLWQEHMHDFVPEDISTIVVDPRKEIVSDSKAI